MNGVRTVTAREGLSTAGYLPGQPARSAETHQRPEAAGARFDRTAQGTPVLQGALAYLECRLHSTQTAGDHTIFIAEVEEVVVRDGEPLLYFRSQYRDIETVGH